MKVSKLDHRFVEFLPDELDDGVLYISTTYATAQHNCCCGCGERVTTPLSPTDWSLTFDGRTVSLHPSIGNWSLPCQSHYWIQRSKIVWAPRLTRDQIGAGRTRDRKTKAAYYAADDESATDERPVTMPAASWWRRLLRRLPR